MNKKYTSLDIAIFVVYCDRPIYLSICNTSSVIDSSKKKKSVQTIFVPGTSEKQI